MAMRQVMRKRIVIPTVAVLSIVALILAFGWDAGEDETEPEPTTYDQSTTTYLEVATQLVPGFADDPEQDVIRVGKEVCRWYDEGSRTDELVDVLSDVVPRKEAQTLINVSIEAFCPEYESSAKGGK